MSHNKQKKIAIINDISGFGRCSVAVSLPVISHMKVQGCVLPTAVFSNHTGFPSYYYEDYTAHIIRQFRDARTKVILDPVMGENGKAYPTYTEEMCDKMKELVQYADILTPNVTEACMLADMPYKASGWSKGELHGIMERLRELGAGKIVVSGLTSDSFITNAISERPGDLRLLRQKRVGKVRSGTGDIFSAVIAADCVNGAGFEESVRKAAAFVRDCILVTEKLDIPETDGVCFEEVLYKLK